MKDIPNYHFVRKLNQGGYGKIYVAQSQNTHEEVIIKIMKKTEKIRELVDHEISVLRRLGTLCPSYVVLYIDLYQDERYYYLIMEYLKDYIEFFDYIVNDENSLEGIDMIYQNTIRGLYHIHEAGCVHRDIKPENIMINPQTKKIKYIDFDFSGFQHEATTIRIMGSVGYISPELLLLSTEIGEHKRLINFDEWVKADIWSLGVTLINLIIRADFYRSYPESLGNTSDPYSFFYSLSLKKGKIDLSLVIPNEFILEYPHIYQGLCQMIIVNPQERSLPDLEKIDMDK